MIQKFYKSPFRKSQSHLFVILIKSILQLEPIVDDKMEFHFIIFYNNLSIYRHNSL